MRACGTVVHVSGVTSDRSDPRLGYGVDDEPVPQHEVYLVLSDEERAKGFVRPVRHAYMHVGSPGPKHPLRDLTPEESERFAKYEYVKYEKYPESEEPALGRFWTRRQLDEIGKGCGVVTTMGTALAETYARDPGFYGATYCCGCRKHLRVGAAGEFTWVDGGERVGT